MRNGDPGSARRLGYFRSTRAARVSWRGRLSLLPGGQGAHKLLRAPIRCRRKSRSRPWGECRRLTVREACWTELPRRGRGRGIGADLKWSVLGVGKGGRARIAAVASVEGGSGRSRDTASQRARMRSRRSAADSMNCCGVGPIRTTRPDVAAAWLRWFSTARARAAVSSAAAFWAPLAICATVKEQQVCRGGPRRLAAEGEKQPQSDAGKVLGVTEASGQCGCAPFGEQGTQGLVQTRSVGSQPGPGPGWWGQVRVSVVAYRSRAWANAVVSAGACS